MQYLLSLSVGIDTPIRIVYYAGSDRREEVHPKWELLTTHCARRTFVVNALRLGIPAEVIMKWTGHSDFSDTLACRGRLCRPQFESLSLREHIMDLQELFPKNSPKRVWG